MGVFDVLLSLGGILLHEILVNGKTDQFDAITKRMPAELAQIRPVFSRERFFFGDIHLPMQDVHTFDAILSGLVDHCFDGDLGIAKMPVRVGA